MRDLDVGGLEVGESVEVHDTEWEDEAVTVQRTRHRLQRDVVTKHVALLQDCVYVTVSQSSGEME